MPNTLLTIQDITNEAARVLTNTLVFPNAFNRQYEPYFGRTGKKAGDTISVRKPPRYLGRRGEQANVEDSTEQFVALTLRPLYGCDLAFSTTDLTLSIDMFSERFIKPAIATVANMIDVDCANLYRSVSNLIGVAGTPPATALAAAQLITGAGQMLSKAGAPNDGNRFFIVDPGLQSALVSSLSGLFNPGSTISRNFRTGSMGDDIMGFNFAMDQNVASLTRGTAAAAGIGTLVAAVTNGATTLNVTGLTANATLRAGETITIADTAALSRWNVNPQSRQAWGSGIASPIDDRFTVTVTADTLLDGAGANAAVPITPQIFLPGDPRQNVVFAPTTTAAATLPIGARLVANKGSAASLTTKENLAFHRDAFVFASVDQELPGNGHEAYIQNESGISVRLVKGYDINQNNIITRIDVLAGMAAVYPELAVRVMV